TQNREFIQTRQGLRTVIGADHERQRQAFLVLILALLVRVTGAADRLGAEEENLSDAFVGVDLGRQWCRIADLDRNLAPPLRFQRGNVDDYPAARKRRFAQTNREDVAWDLEILDGLRQRKAVGRDQTVVGLDVYEGVRCEILRVDNGAINIGKYL